MRRRELLLRALVGGPALFWIHPADAQSPVKPLKVGILFPGTEAAASPRIGAISEGLHSVGFSEPQIELVLRITGGIPSRVTPLLDEIIAQKVDVLIPISPAVVRAAHATTKTIPIVAHDLETDPVASDMVASLAHPGGNITGLFFDFPEFSGKWLQLMKEALPSLGTVVALWDPATGPTQPRAIERAAQTLGIKTTIQEVRSVGEFTDAFSAVTRQAPDALLILSSPVFGLNLEKLASLTLEHRVPAVTLFPEFARAGGLMAYGPDLLETFRQVGIIAGKVLKGTRPAELPVERSTKFQLVVNLKTASALGLRIPTTILARADEVIE